MNLPLSGWSRLLRSLLHPPTLSDDERTAQARMVHRVAWLVVGIVTLFLGVLITMQPATALRRVHTIVILLALTLPALVLNAKGRTRLAAWTLVGAYLLIVLERAATSGGISAPASALFVAFTMVSGLLLGNRGAAATGAAFIVLGAGLVVAEAWGLLPPDQLHFSPVVMWIYSSLCLVIVVLVQRQITATLRASLDRAHRELTERQAAEQRLALALQAGEAGVWSEDPATAVYHADARLFELYGIPMPPDRRLPLETWLERVLPEDRPGLLAARAQLHAGAPAAHAAFRIRRPDGSLRHIEAAGTVVLDAHGRTERVIGINRDVTARMRAEHERAHLLHDLTERVKELQLLHQAARLLRRDRAADQALFQDLVALLPAGWQYPEICRARVSIGAMVAVSDGWRETPWRLRMPFATSQGNGVLEVVYLEERPAAAEGPFLAEERRVLESLAEMLVSYLELRTHLERLEELVERRTRELRIAKEESERASRAKSTFLATMSHEIRTPMNAVLGYAQLLRRDRSLSPEQQAKVETILSSGDHLLSLLTNVLEMSRIEAGHAALHVSSFDLPAVLEGLQRMFLGIAHTKAITLSIATSPALPRTVVGDVGKIRQVIINLLGNALKFTPAGQVWLNAEASTRPDGRIAVEVIVGDTGPGIDPDETERIFAPFAQSHAGARAGGAGLGLAICRELAWLMGGDLTVRSTLGAGSAFTFRFLVDQAADNLGSGVRGAVARPCLRLAPMPSPPKVVVADDLPEMRELTVAMLEPAGFAVRQAASGEEAILLHDAWRPDVVLIDAQMPGIGGVEAIRRMRTAGAVLPIVMLTASGLGELKAAALAAGATEVLFRPIGDAELCACLAAVLRLAVVAEGQEPPVTPSAGIVLENGRTSVHPSLALLFAALPPALLERISSAAGAAHLTRLTQAAADAAAIAPAAGDAMRSLLAEFRYEELATAAEAARLPR